VFFGLFGQNHLPAEALVLSTQSAEVDATSTTAPLAFSLYFGDTILISIRAHNIKIDLLMTPY